jgi:hypothetical protein
MIWDIDLTFGMSVYNHKLQIKFEIHSGWMIFGQLNIHGRDIIVFRNPNLNEIIDYCILTMEIMEIYHTFSSDNDSQIWEWQGFRIFPDIFSSSNLQKYWYFLTFYSVYPTK